MLVAERQPDEWVREQIAALPPSAADELALGPSPGPQACGICLALKHLEHPMMKMLDRSLLHCGPVTNLLDYHANDAGEPAVDLADAEEIWERCRQIYRCAGWPG